MILVIGGVAQRAFDARFRGKIAEGFAGVAIDHKFLMRQQTVQRLLQIYNTSCKIINSFSTRSSTESSLPAHVPSCYQYHLRMRQRRRTTVPLPHCHQLIFPVSLSKKGREKRLRPTQK